MGVLLAVGALLRALFLGSKSLWFDEACGLIIARQPAALIRAFLLRTELSPPLYTLTMHFWLKLFADPLLGLRLFSALFVYRDLVRRLLPERARLLALAFGVFSSYWIHLSQDGRPYALLILISLLSTRAALELTDRPSPRAWAAYAALACAGLYEHYYFAVLLAAHAGWLAWTARRSRRELAAWAAAHAAAALAFAPWLPTFALQFATHRHDLVVGDPLTLRNLCSLSGTLFFDPVYLGLLLPPLLVPAVGAAVLLCAAAAGASAARSTGAAQRRAAAFVLWHLAVPLALIALAEFAVGRPVTQARYFAPFSAFFYMAAALALAGDGVARRAARLALVATVLSGTAAYFASVRLIDPRLEALSASIRRATPPDLPLVYTETYYYLPMRAYYMPERRHYLIAEAAEGMDYAGFPPYDGVLDRERLKALGPCLVMDEKFFLGGTARWVGDGARVAALVAAAPAFSSRRAP
jgi:uncharacterized membrane protein